MEALDPHKAWIEATEKEIKELHEQITRLDDQGRYDFRLTTRINELQESMEAAKRLLPQRP